MLLLQNTDIATHNPAIRNGIKRRNNYNYILRKFWERPSFFMRQVSSGRERP